MNLKLTILSIITLYQPSDGYRFSLEPFVIANSIKTKRKHGTGLNIVDFGSGSGIIALLVAKRFPSSKLYAVEKNSAFREIIAKNISLNRLENIEILNDTGSIKPNSIDIVLSNPPYFRSDSYRPSSRHFSEKFDESMGIDLLLSESRKILKNKGVLIISYHPTRLVELITKLKEYKFGTKSITPAYGSKKSQAQFIVVETQFAGKDHTIIKPPVDLEKLSQNLRCEKG